MTGEDRTQGLWDKENQGELTSPEDPAGAEKQKGGEAFCLQRVSAKASWQEGEGREAGGENAAEWWGDTQRS